MSRLGVLGYLGHNVDSGHVQDASRRAPWRGSPTWCHSTDIGGIVALGTAAAGHYKHLSIALHGRIDNVEPLARGFNQDPEHIIPVVGESYLRYGDAFASQLLGDFAILILDERRGAMIGTRDWVGSRPLYWGHHNGVVAFGSEVKQVLALLDLPHRVNEQTALEYAAMGEPAVTATFAEGVEAVAPSGQVSARVGQVPIHTTRSFSFESHDLSLSEVAPLIRSRLETAVLRRMSRAERPCVLISGGMDSTSVAAVASSLAQRGEVAPIVAGISLHFPDVPKSDETRYSRDVAERWKIPWEPVALAPPDVATDPSEMLALHDGPPFPGVQMFDRMFSRAAEQRADVLLTGQVADHWQTQTDHEMFFSGLRHEWGSLLSWMMYDLHDRPKWTAKQLIKTGLGIVRRCDEGHIFANRANSFWTRFACEIEERLGQYHGFQVESPFYDRELAEVLAGVTPALRSTRSGEKMPLRKAMSDFLPESVLQRMDKSFFDPVYELGYGTPSAGRSILQTVSEVYLTKWRCMVAQQIGDTGGLRVITE